VAPSTNEFCWVGAETFIFVFELVVVVALFAFELELVVVAALFAFELEPVVLELVVVVAFELVGVFVFILRKLNFILRL
jgi:hypothetical protein